MIKQDMVNSRMKEFYDIYGLSFALNFQGARLKKVGKSTFQRKKTTFSGNPLVFRSEFHKDIGRQRQWIAFFRRSQLSYVNQEFNQILKRMITFLGPIRNFIKDRTTMDKLWDIIARCWKNEFYPNRNYSIL